MVLPTRGLAAHSCLQQNPEVIPRQPPYIKRHKHRHLPSTPTSRPSRTSHTSSIGLQNLHGTHTAFQSHQTYRITSIPCLPVTSPSRIPSICTEYGERFHPSHLPPPPDPAQANTTIDAIPPNRFDHGFLSIPRHHPHPTPPPKRRLAVVYNSPAYSRQ